MEEKKLSSLAKLPNDTQAKMVKKAPEEPKPEVKSVVKSSAVVKRKGPIKRFLSKIFADDFDDIKTSIISDTLLPAVRDMIFDAIMGWLSMSLYGDTYRGSKSRFGRGGSHIDYGKISTGGYKKPSDRSIRSERSSDMSDLVFEYREDAMAVLDGIMDQMETYDSVSVADVYVLAGGTPNFTDNKYGWDNPSDLAKMKVVRVGREWSLKLPRPYPID